MGLYWLLLLVAGVLAAGAILGVGLYKWSQRRERLRRENHHRVLGRMLQPSNPFADEGQGKKPPVKPVVKGGAQPPKTGKQPPVVPGAKGAGVKPGAKPPVVPGAKPPGAAGAKPPVNPAAKPGNAGAQPPAKPGAKESEIGKPSETAGAKPPGDASKPPEKPPTNALIPYVPPDAVRDDHVRVNNHHLFTAVVEPNPLISTRAQARQAYDRAKKQIELSMAARKRHDYDTAETHAYSALDEVHGGMKRDHWYAADVLNMLGCLKYDRGFYLEARELWEQADEVALEWFEQCRHIAPTIESNLKLVRGMLGF